MIEFILQEIEGDGQESVKIQRFDRWQLTGSPDFCVFWVLYEILVSLDLLLSVLL